MYIRYPIGKIKRQVQKVVILADIPCGEAQRQGRRIGLAVDGQAFSLDIILRLNLHRHYAFIHLQDKFHFSCIA